MSTLLSWWYNSCLFRSLSAVLCSWEPAVPYVRCLLRSASRCRTFSDSALSSLLRSASRCRWSSTKSALRSPSHPAFRRRPAPPSHAHTHHEKMGRAQTPIYIFCQNYRAQTTHTHTHHTHTGTYVRTPPLLVYRDRTVHIYITLFLRFQNLHLFNRAISHRTTM